MRCKWCGTPESPAWTTTDTGVYCSRECTQASKTGETFTTFFIYWYIASGLAGILLSTAGVTVWVALVFSLFAPIVVGSPLLVTGLMEYRHRRAVSKDSRSAVVPSNISLLKTLPLTAPCPQCDTSIDLKKVGPDLAYSCDHCGAKGTIKILGTDLS